MLYNKEGEFVVEVTKTTIFFHSNRPVHRVRIVASGLIYAPTLTFPFQFLLLINKTCYFLIRLTNNPRVTFSILPISIYCPMKQKLFAPLCSVKNTMESNLTSVSPQISQGEEEDRFKIDEVQASHNNYSACLAAIITHYASSLTPSNKIKSVSLSYLHSKHHTSIVIVLINIRLELVQK